MPLFKPGDRVCDRYIIEKLAGAGAMSEVYRGRDLRVNNRLVAIKALRRNAHGTNASRAQAVTEVRSLSALAHPHIAVLYDVCTHDEADVMVMEFLEGSTLAERLRDGPLPERDALRLALQIADALACAHRQGVVHRDIKPGNIMLTPQGVKLLDFGLAQLSRPRDSPRPLEPRPPGKDTSIVGTPFYMSPEQLGGRDVDHRADIYAFGLVLSQMYTGFIPDPELGIAHRTVVAGVIEQIPSAPVRMIAEKCLRPDRSERWSDTTDLYYALTVVAETKTGGSMGDDARKSWRPAWVVAPVVIGAALVATATWWAFDRVPVRSPYEFAISPAAGTQLVSLEAGGPPAISPDGRTLAFVAADANGQTLIYTRLLGDARVTPVIGSDGASHPFWSPDSRSLAFFAHGRLLRMALPGGQPRILSDVAQARGGSWSKDGVIVFTPGFTEALYRIPADGGKAERITTLEFAQLETSHRWPVFLPDGRRFLFFVRSDRAAVQGLYEGSLDSPQRTRIGDIASSAAYADPGDTGTGYLLFARDGALTAQAFSPSQSRLLGEPIAIAQLKGPEEDTSVAPVSASTNGVVAYGSGGDTRQAFVWVDRSGQETGKLEAQGQYRNLQLSPDRKKLAAERLELRTGLAAVWLFDLGRDVQQRFGPPSIGSFGPVWIPGGENIMFVLNRGSDWELRRRSTADESELTIATSRMMQAATDWSRDAKWLIFQQQGSGAAYQWDVGALEVATGKTKLLLDSPSSEHQAQLSPDGSWLAYTSDESGRDQVYLRRFPLMNPRLLVSAGGGSQPRWSADGRELFYISANQEMMSVTFDASSDPPTLSSSRVLFKTRIAPATGLLSFCNYDVDSERRRFLIAAPPITVNPLQQIAVIVNWPERVAID